jgi:hypothetical protein
MKWRRNESSAKPTIESKWQHPADNMAAAWRGGWRSVCGEGHLSLSIQREITVNSARKLAKMAQCSASMAMKIMKAALKRRNGRNGVIGSSSRKWRKYRRKQQWRQRIKLAAAKITSGYNGENLLAAMAAAESVSSQLGVSAKKQQ